MRGAQFIVEPSRAHLTEIAHLIEAGKLRPIIEATFPLEAAREAFERGLSGHNRGKLVLRVAEAEKEKGSLPLRETELGRSNKE